MELFAPKEIIDSDESKALHASRQHQMSVVAGPGVLSFAPGLTGDETERAIRVYWECVGSQEWGLATARMP